MRLAGKEAATGTVKFLNLGKPQTITLSLVKQRGGWRVREIIARGQRLSALFARK